MQAVSHKFHVGWLFQNSSCFEIELKDDELLASSLGMLSPPPPPKKKNDHADN